MRAIHPDIKHLMISGVGLLQELRDGYAQQQKPVADLRNSQTFKRGFAENP